MHLIKFQQDNNLKNTGIFDIITKQTIDEMIKWQTYGEAVQIEYPDVIQNNEKTCPNSEKGDLTYVTLEQLKDFGWNTNPKYLNADIINRLNSVLNDYAITDEKQIIHFLSQVAAESDDWNYSGYGDGVVEIGSDEYIIRQYSERKDLGNNGAEDALKYRGAGYIHLTGRSNYEAFYEHMKKRGIDDNKILTEGYKRVSDKYAWESAAYYWTKPKLTNGNSIKDEIDNIIVDNIITKTVDDNKQSVTVSAQESVFWISYLVNGGYNGIQKRINTFEKIKNIMEKRND